MMVARYGPVKRIVIGLWFLAWLGPGWPVQAGEYFEANGVAIRGYDPVAYFTDRTPMVGSERHSAEYRGSVFRFASAAHRDAFKADPEKFAPQYGGFCALGMARGYKASIDPAAFTIVEGKLYLNYSLGVREQWSKGISGYIAKADRNWPEVRKSTKVVQ
jgi:YHS domain-containing protein